MRWVIAVVMALHGIAHMVGFAGSWQLAASGDLPYKTTVLGGQVDLGSTGIRALGLVWVVASLAFVIVAAGAVLQTEWWMTAALSVSVASLALTILELPAARIGLALNVALIATLLLVQRYDWV
jgi:hypothetical protein